MLFLTSLIKMIASTGRDQLRVTNSILSMIMLLSYSYGFCDSTIIKQLRTRCLSEADGICELLRGRDVFKRKRTGLIEANSG